MPFRFFALILEFYDPLHKESRWSRYALIADEDVRAPNTRSITRPNYSITRLN
jgi:hypothetical protein